MDGRQRPLHYAFRQNTVFPVIEAGYQIQAEGQTFICSNRSRESKSEYQANCTLPGSTLVHCVIRAYCVISRTAVWRLKKKRSSNRSPVSNRSRGSDTIALIEVGGFY